MSDVIQRRLASIVSADVVGYSRLMGLDEVGTHARLKARYAELIQPKIAAHNGRVVKLMGDGMGHFIADRDLDAVNAAGECLRHRPDFHLAVLCLTVALGQLDRGEEAKAAAAVVLGMLPGFSLAAHERSTPISQEADRQRYIDGLRKAGLPE